MLFFGAEPVTTIAPPPAGIEVGDPNTYIFGLSLFFVVSVFANSLGIVGQWN